MGLSSLKYADDRSLLQLFLATGNYLPHLNDVRQSPFGESPYVDVLIGIAKHSLQNLEFQVSGGTSEGSWCYKTNIVQAVHQPGKVRHVRAHRISDFPCFQILYLGQTACISRVHLATRFQKEISFGVSAGKRNPTRQFSKDCSTRSAGSWLSSLKNLRPHRRLPAFAGHHHYQLQSQYLPE